jgi:lipoate-protein ligase A
LSRSSPARASDRPPWDRPAWDVVEQAGPAAELHAASAAALGMDPPRRTARVLTAVRPALVLGSAQPETDFDPGALDRSGLEVARRRSGGGAVIVGPGRVLWIDFVLPAGDALWDDDVGRAAWWVGELWRQALIAVGLDPEGVEVWRGPMVAGRAAAQVCFAGLGPGEVRVGGGKSVGVSQRRTRRAALFQTAAMLEWTPADYLSILTRPAAGGAELSSSVTALGPIGAGLHAAILRLLVP